MDKKETARSLYENEGMSLSQISKRLDINYNTIRSWKNRQNWKTQKDSQKRGRSQNSQANLQKHPNFETGNKEAIKHGLYSKYIRPEYKEVYDSLDEIDPLELLKELIRMSFANFIAFQSYLDFNDLTSVSTDTNLARTVATLIRDYYKIKETTPEDEDDDNFIVAIKYAADKVWDDVTL